MFDLSLTPNDASYVVAIESQSIEICEALAWCRSHLRSNWNTTGWLSSLLFENVHFWFIDEFDFDRFRVKFGGASI